MDLGSRGVFLRGFLRRGLPSRSDAQNRGLPSRAGMCLSSWGVFLQGFLGRGLPSRPGAQVPGLPSRPIQVFSWKALKETPPPRNPQDPLPETLKNTLRSLLIFGPPQNPLQRPSRTPPSSAPLRPTLSRSAPLCISVPVLFPPKMPPRPPQSLTNVSPTPPSRPKMLPSRPKPAPRLPQTAPQRQKTPATLPKGLQEPLRTPMDREQHLTALWPRRPPWVPLDPGPAGPGGIIIPARDKDFDPPTPGAVGKKAAARPRLRRVRRRWQHMRPRLRRVRPRLCRRAADNPWTDWNSRSASRSRPCRSRRPPGGPAGRIFGNPYGAFSITCRGARGFRIFF